MIVYKYRLAAPHEGGDIVLAQMRLAHIYRNTLTEIENGRRTAVRTAEESFGTLAVLATALRKTEDELTQALTELGRTRASVRRRGETATQTERVRAARAEKRVAAKAFRDERARLSACCANCRKADVEAPCAHATPDALLLLVEYDRIAELAGELQRSARAHCGLGKKGPFFGAWGTYVLVEAAAKQAFKTTPIYTFDGRPQNVRYVRWDGAGEVGVQIQNGDSIESVTSGGQWRLTIDVPSGEPRPGEPWVMAPRQIRKEASRHGTLSMNLGNNAAGDQFSGQWRLDMFRRPLPAGSIIKRATVHRIRVGPIFRWYLTVTLDNVPGIACTPSESTLAIDVGWRIMGDEIRVATWRTHADETGELRLSAQDIRLLRGPQEIRSARDARFEDLKLRLGTWLARGQIPDWLVLATESLGFWRSPKRAVALLRQWRDHRFAGDEILFCALQAFCEVDWHKWAEEAVWREKALLRRREKYRIFAAEMAERHVRLVLEADDKKKKVFDMRPLVVTPDTELAAQNTVARSNRFLVAIYELRGSLLNAFRRRGREIVLIPARDTTRTCNVCGVVEARNAASAVVLSCGGCGAVWDQDDNACLNLLRGFERGGGDQTPEGAREDEDTNENEQVTEDHWAKARRQGKARKRRRGSARKATDKAAE